MFLLVKRKRQPIFFDCLDHEGGNYLNIILNIKTINATGHTNNSIKKPMKPHAPVINPNPMVVHMTIHTIIMNNETMQPKINFINPFICFLLFYINQF